MDGVYILGTGTDVGKTVFSGGLLKMLYGVRKARYWKPIQTGTIVGDDTADVKQLVDLPPDAYLEPAYRFPDPLSPAAAASKWGKTIDIDTIVDAFKNHKGADTDFVILEGAGGIYLPINEKHVQLEMVKRLKLPVIVLTNDTVGSINHTLLTLEVLNNAHANVMGVVMMKSRGGLGNKEAIVHFGKVEVLAEFPPYEDGRNLIAQVGGNSRLRQAFKLPALP